MAVDAESVNLSCRSPSTQIYFCPKPPQVVPNARSFFLESACHGQWQASMMLAARVLLQILEHVDDLFNFTGLVEEIVRSEAEAFFSVFRRRKICQHDDLGSRSNPLDVFQQIDSAALRHTHVENRDVGFHALYQVKSAQ